MNHKDTKTPSTNTESRRADCATSFVPLCLRGFSTASPVLPPGFAIRSAAARRGFTLVEMLVVIVIIGMLAALAMAGLFASQESARRTRTEGFIGQLNNHMAYRWETYRTRRLPVTNSYADASIEGTYAYDVRALKIGLDMDPDDPRSHLDNQRAAAMQLIARRQLMRIELPDRWYDVAFDDDTWTPPIPPAMQLSLPMADFLPEPAYDGALGPVINSAGVVAGARVLSPFPGAGLNPPGGGDAPTPWDYVERARVSWINRTSLSYAYMRRYQQVVAQRGAVPTRLYQGAECLYMILTTGMGDETTGGGAFNQRDYADVDDDGMPEFVDGWGRPIGFLRWAPGFRSDMQTGNPDDDHDPFDPRRVDTLAFRLFPLIYSAGPDGAYSEEGSGNSPFGIEGHSGPIDPASTRVNLNDPYAPSPNNAGAYVFRGTPLDESAGIGPNDNIFNQKLQVR